MGDNMALLFAAISTNWNFDAAFPRQKVDLGVDQTREGLLLDALNVNCNLQAEISSWSWWSDEGANADRTEKQKHK